MKILHVVDHSLPLHSGYTFRSRAIFEAQKAKGWKTFHITGPKHAFATAQSDLEEDVDGLHFYRTEPSQGVLSKLPVLNQWAVIDALRKRLDEVVQELRPDVIHAHSPALNGVAALQVGKRHRIPVVYEIRGFWEDAAVTHGTSKEGGLRYRLTRNMETWVARQADALTCICEGIRGDMIKRGIPAEKITIAPNAVDIARFRQITQRDESLAQELGIEDNKVVGFIGSFYAYEGLPLLLEAVPRMLEHVPNLKVLLVGGGQDETRLKSQVEQLGIEDKVIFTGRVPHDQVERYYSLLDLLIYPRMPLRIVELVTPLKPLEAMAQHVFVVASDVGGHRELIVPGETGELFKAGDADDLASKVTGLLQHPEVFAEIKAKARHFVEQERNWAKTADQYEPVYSKLVKV